MIVQLIINESSVGIESLKDVSAFFVFHVKKKPHKQNRAINAKFTYLQSHIIFNTGKYYSRCTAVFLFAE